MTIPQAFDLALQQHQAGRLAEAEAIYRQILAVDPRHTDALNLLGVIAHQVGQHQAAVDLLRQAIALAPGIPGFHSNLGEAQRALGQMDEAVAAFRAALALNPDYADALNNLGNALTAQGRFAEAVAACERAIQLRPEFAEAHSNLGNALMDLSRPDEAVAAYRRAIELKPGYVQAHSNLGHALAETGQLAEAIAACQRALELQPDFALAHNNLGSALQLDGRVDEAMACYRRALQLQPDYAEAHYNLGNAFFDQGHLEESIAAFRRAIQCRPSYAEAHNNLGNALKEQGHADEAIAVYQRAIALQPDFAEPLSNLGNALTDRGQLGAAVAALEQALQLRPDDAKAHSNLGHARAHQARLDDAMASYRTALALNPDFAEAHSNLGNAYKEAGLLDDALASYRRAVAQKNGSPKLHSNLVYVAWFHPGFDAQALRAESARWAEQHAAPLAKKFRPHLNDPSPGRRLKVGYVSPDFSRHVICHFLTPLLEAHDHAAFEIYCYASVKNPDAITARLKKSADVWRDVLGWRDEALAELIREDRIDLLVDLTQHMANNRLLTFARRPAPVQVSWLGYPGSTGLAAMDYRLTDAVMEPEGAAWAESVEKAVRLPDSWFCFDPLDEYPEPSPLPALRAGHITFGSLNNFCKINDAVLELWAEALRAVEGSRLILQCPAGTTQARVQEWFESHGIAAHRLELFARTPTRVAFLQLFARIDLALEPFPYNGGTTTCEALWMGIPVPTFPGTTSVARLGLSILSAAGMPEFIAASPSEYVRLITGLAHDLPRLAALRASLRERMKASAFMDAPRFARNVEHAYRTMWRAWCAAPSAPPPS